MIERLLLGAAMAAVATLGGGGSEGPAAGGPAPPAGSQDRVPTDGPGVFLRKIGGKSLRFVPWESEESVERVFAAMRIWGGGEVHFAPGTYTLERGFRALRVPNLTVSGSPGVLFQFAPGPEQIPLTTAEVEEGDTVIEVDRADGLQVGRRYQLYSPKRSGARVLEFEIDSIEGCTVHLKRPVAFMPRVEEIPAGSKVLEELNAFRFRDCPNLEIRGLTIDGRGRGPVRGHTIYCGVYATGRYRAGERPTTAGMVVRNCTFRNLMGRGVCVYGLADVLIEGSSFHDIHAQAIEIDHYSSGRVISNQITGAEVGVMVNDAFETVVEGNVISGCWRAAVRILRIFPENWVNVGNAVRDNRIGPNCGVGVVIETDIDVEVNGNAVEGNHFVGLGPEERVIAPTGNEVEGNTHEP